MPLVSGAVSVTRCDVVQRPSPDFESQAFRAIAPGSEVRESLGFVPFEPGAEYQIGTERYAFRVRLDRLRPDPTAVKERVRELLRVEREQAGVPMVGARRVRELRALAEEELLQDARPQSTILEGVLDGRLVYLGTAADTHLGRIVQLLRKAGVLVDFKTPWNDLGQEQAESDFLEVRAAHQSVHGCTFLERLFGDDEIAFEPSDGYAKLQTRTARVVLSGGVLPELQRYVDEGALVLAVKLLTATSSYRLDALSFRLSGLRLERPQPGHWSERLDERLDAISAVFEQLDRKYAQLLRARRRPQARAAVPAAAGAGAEERADNVVPFER
ncbi:MAG TPA: hypothetical protein VNB06_21820 [Thermoanaerobaculia bacterium]|nr:hypothetical protein [Thermoanaerobaculia bacterium]